MDFELALKAKRDMGEIFIVEGIRFNLYITPEDNLDFERYCKAFEMSTCTDETALQFCSNGQYEIRAIRIEEGELKWEFPEIQQL